MDKLIELLNKHRREKVNKQSGITQWHYNAYTFSLDNISGQQAELLIISKQYGFIKWLISNDKIELPADISDVTGWAVVYKNCTPTKECYLEMRTNYVLMYLAIQEDPVEFLVSILK